MSGFLIGLFTFILVIASLFLVFLVLLQRGSGQGGMGAAFGGGMAESAFGGETNKVLTRATVVTSVLFFVLGLGLYMAQISRHKDDTATKVDMEAMVATADAQAQAEAAAQVEPAEAVPGEATTKAMEVLDKEAPLVEEPNAAIAPTPVEDSAEVETEATQPQK